MGIVAFLLESPCGSQPRSIREHLRMQQPSWPVADVESDPVSDAAIGRRYARLGAKRVLTEAMDGGSDENSTKRTAEWRALFVIHAGTSHRHILDMGMSARERILAAIRNRALRIAQEIEAERVRCDRAFFGLDATVQVIKRQRLSLAR